ncbi:hypothetical protein R3X26_02870 [Vibrio sp. TH_r3]|uniref:hypothetical protein n=1 Tax=Vibrio sp. TH_r3 TaxID=3082084 RepID=UPI0029556CD3|nr:hypothetical protein [Vibrio sp. TH_r3]MDV7103342.1 hypothetical protein [Vibrio sp. TH_r3]
MSWTILGTTRYLSEFGLKPVRSRISVEDGTIYLSELLKVDPNNMMNSNGYAYYICSQKEQVKALLITTSIEDKKYQQQSESLFKRLVKSLVKQTTAGSISKEVDLVQDHLEQIGEHTFRIEKNVANHPNSLRCILSLTEDADAAKGWLDKIDFHAE